MSTFSPSLRAVLLLGSALVILAGLPACTTVQVTDDQIGEFKLGELQVEVDSDFASAYEATKGAFNEQGLFLTGDERKVVEAVLTARDRTDAQVTVKLKEVAVGRTSVKIRYGLTGDAARSQALFRDIVERI